MFLDFYQMREQAFGVTPDPRFLYLGKSHFISDAVQLTRAVPVPAERSRSRCHWHGDYFHAQQIE